MKIRVALYAGLAQFAPLGTSGRWVDLEVAEGTTVAQVMRGLGMPEDLPCIPVLNGQRVESEAPLADGATLGFFPPLAGGAGPIRD